MFALVLSSYCSALSFCLRFLTQIISLLRKNQDNLWQRSRNHGGLQLAWHSLPFLCVSYLSLRVYHLHCFHIGSWHNCTSTNSLGCTGGVPGWYSCWQLCKRVVCPPHDREASSFQGRWFCHTYISPAASEDPIPGRRLDPILIDGQEEWLEAIRSHYYKLLFFISHVHSCFIMAILHHPKTWLWPWCAQTIWIGEQSWKVATSANFGTHTVDRFNAVSLQGNRSLEQTQDRYICHLFQEKKVVDPRSTIFHGEPELVLANRGFCTDPRSLGHRKSTSSTDSRDLRGEGEGFCDKSTGYIQLSSYAGEFWVQIFWQCA